MRFHNIIYLLKEGGRNIFSNKLMSFACIGVLIACFLLIGSAVLLSLTVNNVVEYVENQNEIVAFLDDGLTSDDIDVIGMALASLDNIGQYTFLSKEEALQNEKVRAGDDAVLYEGLEGSENPFPDSYIIQVKQLTVLEETIDDIVAIGGVDKVISQTDVAAILAGLKITVNYAGMGVVVILIAVSIVIITNTIKLTVFSRRKEINIMKYVGATDSFIRMPFLVEGMLIGLVAAVLAFSILGVSYTYLIDWANENFGDFLGIILTSAISFREIGLFLFAGFAFIGIFIGTIGSGVFVRRYLRV